MPPRITSLSIFFFKSPFLCRDVRSFFFFVCLLLFSNAEQRIKCPCEPLKTVMWRGCNGMPIRFLFSKATHAFSFFFFSSVAQIEAYGLRCRVVCISFFAIKKKALLQKKKKKSSDFDNLNEKAKHELGRLVRLNTCLCRVTWPDKLHTKTHTVAG